MSAALRRIALRLPARRAAAASSSSAQQSSVVANCDRSACPLKSESLSADRFVFSCPSCRRLIDHPEMSALSSFAVFGIERSFDVDTKALKRQFKALQTALHPDKFAGSDDSSQTELAESWSSLVNDSYNRLRRPLDRAQYLLELSGQPLAEGEIQIEPGFLAEVMEVNEEVAEAESPADLSGISEANKTVLKSYVEKVSKAFREGRVKDAKVLVARMKYFSTIQDKIVEKETAFGVV